MSFQFQIVLTEECNLGCTYCYMENKKSVMSKETFDKHYEEKLPELMRRYGKETYTLAFFGGEPLLNLDLIKYIIEKTKEDTRCVGKIIMTNGLLLVNKDIGSWLKENGISWSLSFDGLWNKKNRPFINGESSFDHYVKHKEIYNVGSCKVMVAPDSLDTLVENFTWFVEDFGVASPDFTIVRDDIWSEEDLVKFSKKSRELADKIIEYNENGINAMAGFYLLYMLDTLFGKIYSKRPFGCFAGNSGAGFLPDGKAYPCARFGSEKEYPLDNEKNIELFLKDEVKNPKVFPKCKTCTLYHYCNAGCTHSQLNGEESIPIDSVCDVLSILYNDAYYIANKLKDNDCFKETIINALKNVG